MGRVLNAIHLSALVVGGAAFSTVPAPRTDARSSRLSAVPHGDGASDAGAAAAARAVVARRRCSFCRELGAGPRRAPIERASLAPPSPP